VGNGPGGGTSRPGGTPPPGIELIQPDQLASLLGSGIGDGLSLSLFHVWPWLLAAEGLLVAGIIGARAIRRGRRDQGKAG
jgi:hypothetical protein